MTQDSNFETKNNQLDVYFLPIDESFSSESAPYKLIQLPSEAFLNELLQDFIDRNDQENNQIKNILFQLKEKDGGFVNFCSDKETCELFHIEYSNEMHLGKLTLETLKSNNDLNQSFEDDRMVDISDTNENQEPFIYLESLPLKNMYELNTIPGLKQRIIREINLQLPTIDLEVYMNGNTNITPISLADLENNIPASKKDILQCLKETDAIEIQKNFFIKLNETSMRRTIVYLILLLQYIGEKKLSMDMLKDSEILKPEWAVQIFSVNPFEINQYGVTENGKIEIDKQKLAIYYAEKILFFKKKKFKTNDFLTIWQKKLDIVCNVRLEWILKSGMCLQYDDENVILQHADSILEYFPVNELSLDPKTRFQEIFNKKKIWSSNQLSNYIQDLVTPEFPIEKLIQKFAKSSQTIEGNEKLFILR